MKSRVSLAALLICLLLSDAVLGYRWQGTGSGMNSTVLTEIWTGLERNLDAALTMNNQGGFNAFSKQISDRLNSRWDQAWNVVLIRSQATYDTVLYGYAFNNQWMWFNGVPNTVMSPTNIATLIVWKDYNCQNWGYIAKQANAFLTSQETIILNVVNTITYSNLINDVWGTAFNMMRSLDAQLLGAYTLLMSQDPYATFYGRICRVGSRFYQKNAILTQAINVDGILIDMQYGAFYLFQTRTNA